MNYYNFVRKIKKDRRIIITNDTKKYYSLFKEINILPNRGNVKFLRTYNNFYYFSSSVSIRGKFIKKYFFVIDKKTGLFGEGISVKIAKKNLLKTIIN